MPDNNHEVIIMEPKYKKKRSFPKSSENAELPPSEYDGVNEESGVILTASEAIDVAQGLDN